MYSTLSLPTSGPANPFSPQEGASDTSFILSLNTTIPFSSNAAMSLACWRARFSSLIFLCLFLFYVLFVNFFEKKFQFFFA